MLNCSASPWIRCSCHRLLAMAFAHQVYIPELYAIAAVSCCCLSTDLISSSFYRFLLWSPPPAARGRSPLLATQTSPPDNDDGNDDGDVQTMATCKRANNGVNECCYSKSSTPCGYFVCESVPLCGNRSLKFENPICIPKCSNSLYVQF